MNLIAGSIAHDFNNRLASAIGFTTLAREHAIPGGLGLPAALGIVRAHHGSIDVDSTVGVGTRLTVVIPGHL
jgi:signal transduction histidine kinase